MTDNGHNTYLPQNQDIVLNDTYPKGKNSQQLLYLYDVSKNKQYIIAKMHAPKKYKGSWRCDAHPRTSAKGKYIFIDGTFEGKGRQIYMFETASIIGR